MDLDGTLLDSARDFMPILEDLRRDAPHRPPLTIENLKPCVGDGATAIVRRFIADADDPDFEALRKAFLDRYACSQTRREHLFEGIESLLARLEKQGTPWGVVTNKHRRFAAPVMEHLGLAHRMQCLVCADEVARPKPDPASLYLACQHLGLPAGQVLYAGDHRRDIDAARAAGMPSAACAWGYITKEDPPNSWAATHLVQSPLKLMEFF
jgi:phosphoglycolate phosphatase